MNKITKLLYLISFVIGIMPFSFSLISLFDRGGFYIRKIDYLYCTNQDTCLHELAHRVDFYNGDISQTDKFKISVTLFAIKYPGHAWSKPILEHKTDWPDVYAQMYGSVKGDISLIPQELQEFYYPFESGGLYGRTK